VGRSLRDASTSLGNAILVALPLVGIKDDSDQREDHYTSLATTRYTCHAVTAPRAVGPSGRTCCYFCKADKIFKLGERLHLHTTALAVFCFFFALVTLAGFWAARWRRPKAGMGSLEEWGLAGRSFGTWVTWFLIGGDLYTAYTVIAVPALLYGSGAMGFFAVPYAVITYPYMMLVLPRLWTICHRHGYVTFADFVGGRYGNRWLTMAIALTGVLALMPYIALQLVGIRVVIGAMGVEGEWPLGAAFVILAAYTYSSGLRAPAVIAIVKDLMLYVMVLAALIYIPMRLGGYARVFEVANQLLAHHTPTATIYLK
jgi:SSS family solute:Na+ symporter